MSQRQRAPSGVVWAAGLAVAVIGVFSAVMLVRVTPPAEPREGLGGPDSTPRVSIRRPAGNPAADGNVAPLRDPVPLYLPTSLNSGQSGALSDDGRREPAAAFSPFDAKLAFGENNLRVAFPPTVTPPETLAAAYDADIGPRAFRYLGRRTEPLPATRQRLGFLQVAKAESGIVVLEDELAPVNEAPAVDWSPVEMVAAVNQAGLIGSPAVVLSSGAASLDGWLVNYLASGYRLGERLPPGIYRISLGP